MPNALVTGKQGAYLFDGGKRSISCQVKLLAHPRQYLVYDVLVCLCRFQTRQTVLQRERAIQLPGKHSLDCGPGQRLISLFRQYHITNHSYGQSVRRFII
jgi:hypothetical protein